MLLVPLGSLLIRPKHLDSWPFLAIQRLTELFCEPIDGTLPIQLRTSILLPSRQHTLNLVRRNRLVAAGNLLLHRDRLSDALSTPTRIHVVRLLILVARLHDSRGHWIEAIRDVLLLVDVDQ